MFTGIIQEVGTLKDIDFRGDTARIEIEAPLLVQDAALGDSLCSNGVCLTAAQLSETSFWADLSSETLNRSTFAGAKPGLRINLEPALRPHDRMGGHIVAGHVDGVETIVSIDSNGEFVDLGVQFPHEIGRYIAEKGSVSLDGISLTVTYVSDRKFEVAVVPFTLEKTNLCSKHPGDLVNLEVDTVARYVERLLQYNKDWPPSGLTPDKMREFGY